MEKLFDPELANEAKPSDYVFRLSIKLETGDERYKDKVNTGLWVGSGARRGSEGGFYFSLFFFFLILFYIFIRLLVGLISEGVWADFNPVIVIYDAYRVL